MEWKKEYELGEEKIDFQHRKLVDLINEYNDTVNEYSDNNSAIGEVLTFLINYTNYHFSYEESFMEMIKYPETQSHKQKHRDLVATLRSILFKLKNRETYTYIECYYLLVNWLNDHILGEDRKIAKFNSTNIYNEKIVLENSDNYFTDIEVEMKKIDTISMADGLTAKENEMKRILFLDVYMEKFIFIDTDSFTRVLELLNRLSREKVITKNERQKLYYNLDLEGRFNKNKILRPDYDFSHIKELMNHLRME